MDELSIENKNIALVIIDLQKGISAMQGAPYDSKVVIENASKLAAIFRQNQLPVFLVHVVSSEKDRLNVKSDEQMFSRPVSMPADWADFVPELNQADSDVVIVKKQWGAFYGTDLELRLRRQGIKTIVLCGIATNYGVESTARFAYEFGFEQIFAQDAMTSRSKEMHEASVNYVLKRIGRVRSTQQIIDSITKMCINEK